MIKKKEGRVNEIIFNNTVYNNSKNRIYPTIIELKRIIEEVINSHSTSSYLRITPFYLNSKNNVEIEFEDHMFYIECREQINTGDINNHISACLGIDVEHMNDEQIRKAKILYPLCTFNDINYYKFALENYLIYLDETIPSLMNQIKENADISEDDLCFGYFCFEVHSG